MERSAQNGDFHRPLSLGRTQNAEGGDNFEIRVTGQPIQRELVLVDVGE